jgi:hypothetical protein
VTGRDVEERELALQFAPETGMWELLGDAAEYTLGETRKVILETVDAHGPLTPKQVSELTTAGHELAKKTMQRMFWDGQLAADGGRYSIPFQTPSPMSPSPRIRDGGTAGTAIQRGTGERASASAYPPSRGGRPSRSHDAAVRH